MTMTDAAKAVVDLYCRELKLPGLPSTYQATARDAASQGQSHTAFLAACLAQELLQAQQEYRLPPYLKSGQSFDLVVRDESGYLGLGPGGPLLFQFCAERDEPGSLLITTNLEFARWGEVFGDAALTAALLLRLTHHAQILLFEGESYRFLESKERLKEVTGLAKS